MRVLVTGAAGFIGMRAVQRLLEAGYEVVGLDSLDDYYDVKLKLARLGECGVRTEKKRAGARVMVGGRSGYRFVQMDLADAEPVMDLFAEESFEVVVHLAAQPGVRHSLIDPHAYMRSNILGFCSLIEACRHRPVRHLVYASSSSVYGLDARSPSSPTQAAAHPMSLYAASKRANELMAHSYSHLFGIPCTGLRFFTVYGPWDRPDKALILFSDAILAGRPIEVFDEGRMKRDFTYVDDAVDAIMGVVERPPDASPIWDPKNPDLAGSRAPWRIFNVGCGEPVELSEFIEILEEELGVRADKKLMPIQPGDVPETLADIEALASETGYRPKTSVREGIRYFVAWYREHYRGQT